MNLINGSKYLTDTIRSKKKSLKYLKRELGGASRMLKMIERMQSEGKTVSIISKLYYIEKIVLLDARIYLHKTPKVFESLLDAICIMHPYLTDYEIDISQEEFERAIDLGLITTTPGLDGRYVVDPTTKFKNLLASFDYYSWYKRLTAGDRLFINS